MYETTTSILTRADYPSALTALSMANCNFGDRDEAPGESDFRLLEFVSILYRRPSIESVIADALYVKNGTKYGDDPATQASVKAKFVLYYEILAGSRKRL